MINYGRQNIDNKDIQSVTKVLKSEFLTQGPTVNKFENKLKFLLKAKFAVAVSSGTSALDIAAKVLNWKKNDIVVVSPITFLSSANCIEKTNATTHFIDINYEDYSIDLDKLENALKKFKKKIKAVIITDYAGHPADWKRLYYLKKKYNFYLINDNCHALGSSIDGDRGYAIKYADIVILSFHPVKSITTGEGGALLTNNKNFYKKAVLIRSHGIIRSKKLSLKHGQWYHEMQNIGSNYRMPDINAALGLSQISKLKKFVKKRNYIANFYDKIFVDTEKFKKPKVRSKIKHSYHLYPLLVNFDKFKISKKKLFDEFKKYKINLQVHYIPINTQPYYVRKYGFKKKDFQNSIKFYNQEISLPIYYDLSIKDLDYIKKIIKKIFNL